MKLKNSLLKYRFIYDLRKTFMEGLRMSPQFNIIIILDPCRYNISCTFVIKNVLIFVRGRQICADLKHFEFITGTLPAQFACKSLHNDK